MLHSCTGGAESCNLLSVLYSCQSLAVFSESRNILKSLKLLYSKCTNGRCRVTDSCQSLVSVLEVQSLSLSHWKCTVLHSCIGGVVLHAHTEGMSLALLYWRCRVLHSRIGGAVLHSRTERRGDPPRRWGDQPHGSHNSLSVSCKTKQRLDRSIHNSVHLPVFLSVCFCLVSIYLPAYYRKEADWKGLKNWWPGVEGLLGW